MTIWNYLYGFPIGREFLPKGPSVYLWERIETTGFRVGARNGM